MGPFMSFNTLIFWNCPRRSLCCFLCIHFFLKEVSIIPFHLSHKYRWSIKENISIKCSRTLWGVLSFTASVCFGHGPCSCCFRWPFCVCHRIYKATVSLGPIGSRWVGWCIRVSVLRCVSGKVWWSIEVGKLNLWIHNMVHDCPSGSGRSTEL